MNDKEIMRDGTGAEGSNDVATASTVREDAQHTPGPWHWTSRNGKHYLVTTGDSPHEIVLGWPCGMEDGSWFTGDSYGAADARLIAAAPDLLAACQKFVASFKSLQREKCDVAHRMAVEAIAKAEGRS